MNYIWRHIQHIISTYDGNIPLAHFLNNYYKTNRKLGSRDRKILSAMAYSWYRCSKGLHTTEEFETKIKACLRLCDHNSNPLLQHYLGEDENNSTAFDINNLFPYQAALSDGITKTEWLYAMLKQPDLFIRIRGKKTQITTILDAHGISYTFISNDTLALPNTTAIDKLLPADAYVVQDASSQETGKYFMPNEDESWYDCCAGAGGKSLLLMDKMPSVRLTVSDKRASILHNLKSRFRQYHAALPDAYVVDVADHQQLSATLINRQFDGIICDAPCTGSGTWARTPEQLYFFKPDAVSRYAALQLSIVQNAVSYLKPQGRLVYITCSVFKQENELTVEKLLHNKALHLEEMKLINGTKINADSMFVAVLRKA